jgi:hypothetical protein
MTFVNNPAAYEIHFFAIPVDREAAKTEAVRGVPNAARKREAARDFLNPAAIREAVRDFLNTATSKFDEAVRGTGRSQADPPTKILQLEPFAEEFSDPLTSVDPTETPGGVTLKLDVRTLYDTAMLRMTAAQEGQFELKDVKPFDFSTVVPRPAEPLPNYLGVFHVLYVETDEPEGPKWAEVGKALATDLNWTWLAKAEPIATPLGTMLFGVQPRQRHQQQAVPALDLLFIGGQNTQQLRKSYPLDPILFTLPEMALCHLKVRNSADNLRFTWLPKLVLREEELKQMLPRDDEEEPDHMKMLALNDELTARQARLVDAVEHAQVDLRTMRINRHNFAGAAHPFQEVAARLQHLLVDQWMRGVALQAENDVSYIQGTLQRAENHFKSIAASAAAYQARELERNNWWLIFLNWVVIIIGALAAYPAWHDLLSRSRTAAEPPPNSRPAPP